MAFFKKKQEKKVDEVLTLKSGTPLEISLISDKNFSNSYKTKLDSFISDTDAIILAPTIKLSTNSKYSIMFKTTNGIFKNTMQVLSYDIKGNVPLIKIRLLDESKKIQRRASFRLNIDLEFNFDVVDSCDDEILKNTDILLSKGKTIDISSGGINFFTNEDISKGDYIKILINVKDLFIIAIASIIHKEKVTPSPSTNYRFSYKCKFENISNSYIEDISRYIFEIQRNLSKKGVMFNE